MQKVIINHWMNIITKYNNYDKEKLDIIEYGLTGLYLTLSKIFIILVASLLLGIIKEVIIFMFIFNIIRTTSFGIHATKSWICLLSSSLIFLGIPYICKIINLNTIFTLVIGILGTLLILKNSPADTKKRPIVNPKRRKIYKLLSTMIAIIYVVLSLFVKNNFISNSFIFALILQNILISPLTYKIFKQPYNNYKQFLNTHPDFLK